ncbi:hypothetical protein SADUNF_Sadunf05G0183800 [Salix dunnii]|uniref:Protein kinase domain-containing protein n=1 Tax=Salix dunnii TaxID=1413687 RepID=A0A835K2Q1_9ROSI|nr:hypothetical protein SADUNF_Sadunf05G0183800 [Salix dunnii]
MIGLSNFCIMFILVQDNLVTKDCSECCKGLVEKVGDISSSVQKVLMKVADHCTELSVLTEINSEISPSLRGEESPDVHEIKSCTIQRFERIPTYDSIHLKDCSSTGYKEKVSLRSISVIRRQLPESALGWPLLQGTNHDSIVKKCNIEGTIIQLFHASETESKDGSINREDEKFGIKQNFLWEGGCSNVYKGYLPGGKQVAVKILKQYKEARDDDFLEVDIMSLLKHITLLIGVCIENDHLILVYDFLSKGSLEERLQGKCNSIARSEVRRGLQNVPMHRTFLAAKTPHQALKR